MRQADTDERLAQRLARYREYGGAAPSTLSSEGGVHLGLYCGKVARGLPGSLRHAPPAMSLHAMRLAVASSSERLDAGEAGGMASAVRPLHCWLSLPARGASLRRSGNWTVRHGHPGGLATKPAAASLSAMHEMIRDDALLSSRMLPSATGDEAMPSRTDEEAMALSPVPPPALPPAPPLSPLLTPAARRLVHAMPHRTHEGSGSESPA